MGGMDPRLREAARELAAKPFRPHPLLTGGHAQTIAGWAWPRRFRAYPDEARLFEVEPGVRLLARCRWHEDRTTRTTLVLVHGLGGSADAPYVLGAAHLAYRAGANVVRLNQRNCGGTEHLTPTLYHSGMSGDLEAVVRELVGRDGLSRVMVAGFSMGGNLALKMAGEMGRARHRRCWAYAPSRPRWIWRRRPGTSNGPRTASTSGDSYAACAVSSSARRSSTPISTTSGGSTGCAPSASSTSSTPPHGGFTGAGDYYARSSALSFVPRIRVPTLIVHAQDDPLVPFEPLLRPEISENTRVVTVTPPHGGHVAFVSAEKGDDSGRRRASRISTAFSEIYLCFTRGPGRHGPLDVPRTCAGAVESDGWGPGLLEEWRRSLPGVGEFESVPLFVARGGLPGSRSPTPILYRGRGFASRASFLRERTRSSLNLFSYCTLPCVQDSEDASILDLCGQ